jgi:hypothetical protein
MVDLSELFALKAKLIEAMKSPSDGNLSEVVGYFLDHFAQDPQFVKTGDPYSSGDIDGWLAEAGRRFLGVAVDMSGTPLRRISNYAFVHGGFSMDGHDGIVFYFDDVKQGLITVDVFDRYRCMPCPPGQDFVAGIDPHANYARSFRDFHSKA